MKAIILAGGTGTRLWPLSRDSKPKQFHTFMGERTMLQQTYDRLKFLHSEDIFVSTNENYIDLVKEQLPMVAAKNLIVEPAMRDTGPSFCYSAHILHERGFDEEVMTIVYADHLMLHPEVFEEALITAVDYAEKTEKLGVIAARAKYANPNLGYIKIGKPIATSPEGLDVYELATFVEKPTIERAKEFLHSHKYLWNTGLYLGKVKVMHEAFKTHAPEILSKIESGHYADAPKISFDYAISEKLPAHSMFVIPAELGWNDIGTWAALHEELTTHKDENVVLGEHIGLQTTGSIIYGQPKKIIATYGLKDIVIVDTPDALLVMSKEHSKEVKQIVQELETQSKRRYLQ